MATLKLFRHHESYCQILDGRLLLRDLLWGLSSSFDCCKAGFGPCREWQVVVFVSIFLGSSLGTGF